VVSAWSVKRQETGTRRLTRPAVVARLQLRWAVTAGFPPRDLASPRITTGPITSLPRHASRSRRRNATLSPSLMSTRQKSFFDQEPKAKVCQIS
jgi:hypothetical protein